MSLSDPPHTNLHVLLRPINLHQEDEEEDQEEERFYHAQGTLRDWISREDIRRFVGRRFRRFLNTFKVGERFYYVRLVEELTAGWYPSLLSPGPLSEILEILRLPDCRKLNSVLKHLILP